MNTTPMTGAQLKVWRRLLGMTSSDILRVANSLDLGDGHQIGMSRLKHWERHNDPIPGPLAGYIWTLVQRVKDTYSQLHYTDPNPPVLFPRRARGEMDDRVYNAAIAIRAFDALYEDGQLVPMEWEGDED